MITQAQLNSWLGKSMTDVCLNGYDRTNDNHCAHFVAHAVNLHFGYTCRNHVGGSNAGGNLRVHEIFDRCTNKQEINQCGLNLSGIIFVSGSNNFVTRGGSTTLRNIPRKHIGFIMQGMVWHYSNPRNQVVKQPMTEFLNHYRGQQNSLWYGALPTGSRAIWFGQC
jgi:hypothetical protein